MTIRNKRGNNHLSSCSWASGDTRKPREKPSKHGTGRTGGVSIPQPWVARGELGLRAQPGCEPRDAAGGARNGQCWPRGSAFASHPCPTLLSLLSLLKAERCRKVSTWIPAAAGSGHRSAWSYHPTLTSCYIPKHHFQATATTLLCRGNKRAEPSGSTSPSRRRASSPGSAAGSGGESIDVSSSGWGCRWLGPVFPAEIPPSSSAAPSDTCSEMPPGCALTQERMGGSLGTTPFLPGWLRLVLLLAAAAFGAINSCGSCLWSARSG